MEKAHFQTTTIPKYYLINTVFWGFVTGLVAAAVSYLFFNPMYTMLIIGLFIAVEFMLVLVLKDRPEVILRFKGNELHIRNSDYKDYEVYAVPASAFIFKQSPFDKKRNVGKLRIKGTIFTFYGVQDFENTKQYVEEHFTHY